MFDLQFFFAILLKGIKFDPWDQHTFCLIKTSILITLSGGIKTGSPLNIKQPTNSSFKGNLELFSLHAHIAAI